MKVELMRKIFEAIEEIKDEYPDIYTKVLKIMTNDGLDLTKLALLPTSNIIPIEKWQDGGFVVPAIKIISSGELAWKAFLLNTIFYDFTIVKNEVGLKCLVVKEKTTNSNDDDEDDIVAKAIRLLRKDWDEINGENGCKAD